MENLPFMDLKSIILAEKSLHLIFYFLILLQKENFL